MQLRTRTRASGFTLIELMIVVAVASILVAIAVPTYQSQIRHSRRTDAKTALMDMAVRQEKFLTLQNTYTTTAASLGYSSLGVAPIGSGYYNMYVCVGTATTSTAASASCTAVTGTTGTSFVVSAIPVTASSQAKDTDCQYYAVDNTGTQFAGSSTAGPGSGTVTTPTCWQ
jgi:type IV pilus assembly protein PilE